MDERVTKCVELHDGKVLDVSKIIVLDKVFKNGTASTLELGYSQEYSLELRGTEAELLADYKIIKRAMLGTPGVVAPVQWQIIFEDVQGKFYVNEGLKESGARYLSGLMYVKRLHGAYVGQTIEVALPDKISAKFLITGALNNVLFNVVSDGVYVIKE